MYSEKSGHSTLTHQQHHREGIRHDKNWYLNQLEAYLKLPQSDRIEAWSYFKELFDDAVQKERENS